MAELTPRTAEPKASELNRVATIRADAQTMKPCSRPLMPENIPATKPPAPRLSSTDIADQMPNAVPRPENGLFDVGLMTVKPSATPRTAIMMEMASAVMTPARMLCQEINAQNMHLSLFQKRCGENALPRTLRYPLSQLL